MRSAYDYLNEAIRSVEPQMAYDGGDHAEWVAKAKAKLRELLGMDKFSRVEPTPEIEYEKKIDGATEIRFTFESERGYRVPCHLLLPDGVEKPPVIITLQGHSTGMHISLGRPKYPGDEQTISGGDRDFCVRAVKEGYAAIALEQRNFGECGGTADGPQCTYSSLTAMLMGRTTIGERVWDAGRLIDVLESEFSDRVDTDRICCMGNSGGGTATVYIAALEDRVRLAMPSCAMCTYKDSIGAMPHCACNFVPYIAKWFDMGDLMAMAYPKYFVQVSGKEYPIFPITGAIEVFEKGKTAYEKNGVADRAALIQGNGGHRFYADDAWPIVHKMMNNK